jgi:hypothetical protein
MLPSAWSASPWCAKTPRCYDAVLAPTPSHRGAPRKKLDERQPSGPIPRGPPPPPPPPPPPGARSNRICAPGSTIQGCVCSREHNHAVGVLPGALSNDTCDDTCAPANTSHARLCPREHKYRWIVLPGAQIRLDCAPGRRRCWRSSNSSRKGERERGGGGRRGKGSRFWPRSTQQAQKL